MIVISTHNGENHLKNLLDSLNKVGYTMNVSIVNSASTTKKSISFLNFLEKRNPYNFKIFLYHSEENIWESGVPVFAAKNIFAEKYYFLHDSLIVKHPLFFERLENILEKETVVYLLSFVSNFYDTVEQLEFIEQYFGNPLFEKGCFGSMFFIYRDDLLKLPLNKIPKISNKFETCAMERGWSVLFQNSGLKIKELEGYYDFHRLNNDDYILFTKSFGGRDGIL